MSMWRLHAGDYPAPVAGTYRMRQRVYGPRQTVSGITARPLLSVGPWLPVLIFFGPPHDPDTGLPLDRAPRFQAILNGRYVEMEEVWPWCGRMPITEADYEQLLNGENSHE